ncbi:MAG: YggS family pyridoxal phosphate-dependent enzyme [Clostridia bacterium]|nr:YggS family pyridoxal phosphate-dependent enzyme [Clostridia bacterium]
MGKLSAKEFDANFSVIEEKIEAAVKKIGKKRSDITLLAATKTVDVDTINYAISSGITTIGENKVQEFLSKYDSISPVTHHFIGHLQTNKAKDVVGKVSLIHSVHSLKLAREISKQAFKQGITQEVLLEVNIGEEESKSGFLYGEVIDAIKEISQLPNIFVKGLMAIPPICDKAEENRKYFKKMYNLFVDIREQKIDNSSMEILSMGMSDDFDVAIEEGANLIRVGTALFGKRIYI